MSQLKALLSDDRFKGADLDGQLGFLESYYDKKAELNPDHRGSIIQDKSLLVPLHREKALARDASEEMKPVHTARAKLYSDAARYKTSTGAELGRDTLGEVEAALGTLDAYEAQIKDVTQVNKAGEAYENFLDAGLIEGSPLTQPSTFLSQSSVGLFDQARSLVTGDDTNLAKGLALRDELDEETGGKADQLIHRYRTEQRLEFDGSVEMTQNGAPLIKPEDAVVMSDEEIRGAFKKQFGLATSPDAVFGMRPDVLENFMKQRLPQIRRGTIEVIASLKENEPDEKLRALSDADYAAARIKIARKEGKGAALLQGVGSTLADLGGGVLSLVGKDEAGAKERKQGAALRLLSGQIPGGEFASEIGGVLPDLAIALIPGAGAAKIGSALGAGRKGLQAAGVIGSAVGGGASAGVREFGSSLDQVIVDPITGEKRNMTKREALGRGLKQFAITAGVTAAFGPKGIEKVFASNVAKKGLITGPLGKIFKEAASEGLEEASDELLAYFVLERQLNPDASMEDAIRGAVKAFELGAIVGGGVNIFTAFRKEVTPEQQAEAMNALGERLDAVTSELNLTPESANRLKAELAENRQNPDMIREIQRMVGEAEGRMQPISQEGPLDLPEGAEVLPEESPAPTPEAPAAEETSAQQPETEAAGDQPSPLRRMGGEPFARAKAARAAMTKAGLSAEDYKVSKVEGGFEVRPREEGEVAKVAEPKKPLPTEPEAKKKETSRRRKAKTQKKTNTPEQNLRAKLVGAYDKAGLDVGEDWTVQDLVENAPDNEVDLPDGALEESLKLRGAKPKPKPEAKPEAKPKPKPEAKPEVVDLADEISEEEAAEVENRKDGVTSRIDEAVQSGKIDQPTGELLTKQAFGAERLSDLLKAEDTLKNEISLQDTVRSTGKKPKKRMHPRQRERRMSKRADRKRAQVTAKERAAKAEKSGITRDKFKSDKAFDAAVELGATPEELSLAKDEKLGIAEVKSRVRTVRQIKKDSAALKKEVDPAVTAKDKEFAKKFALENQVSKDGKKKAAQLARDAAEETFARRGVAVDQEGVDALYGYYLEEVADEEGAAPEVEEGKVIEIPTKKEVQDEIVEEAATDTEAMSELLDLEIDEAVEAGEISQETAEALQELGFEAKSAEEIEDVRRQFESERTGVAIKKPSLTEAARNQRKETIEDLVIDGSMPRSDGDEFLAEMNEARTEEQAREIMARVLDANAFYAGDENNESTADPQETTRFHRVKKGLEDFFSLRSLTTPKKLSPKVAKSIASSLSKRFGIEVKWDDLPNESWSGQFEPANSAKGTKAFVRLNSAHLTADTPFHEFAHGFMDVIRHQQPDLYQKLVDDFDSKLDRNDPLARAVLERVNENYGGRQGLPPGTITEELVVHYIGLLAAGKIDPKTGVGQAISKIWNEISKVIKDMFGIAKDVEIPADITMDSVADLLLDPNVKLDISRPDQARLATEVIGEHYTLSNMRSVWFTFESMIRNIREADALSVRTTGDGGVVLLASQGTRNAEFKPDEVAAFGKALEARASTIREAAEDLEKMGGMGLDMDSVTEDQMNEWFETHFNGDETMERAFRGVGVLSEGFGWSDADTVLSILVRLGDTKVAKVLQSERDVLALVDLLQGKAKPGTEVSTEQLRAMSLMKAIYNSHPDVIVGETPPIVAFVEHGLTGGSPTPAVMSGVMADAIQATKLHHPNSPEFRQMIVGFLKGRQAEIGKAAIKAAKGDWEGAIKQAENVIVSQTQRTQEALEDLGILTPELISDIQDHLSQNFGNPWQHTVVSRHLDSESPMDQAWLMRNHGQPDPGPQTRYARITPPGGGLPAYHNALPDTPDYMFGTGGTKIAAIDNAAGPIPGRPHRPFANRAQAESFRTRVAAREGVDVLDLKIGRRGNRYYVLVPGPIRGSARTSVANFERSLNNPLAGATGAPRVLTPPTTPDLVEYLEHPKGIARFLKLLREAPDWIRQVPGVHAMYQLAGAMNIQAATMRDSIRTPIMAYIWKETQGSRAANQVAKQLEARFRGEFEMNDEGQVTNIGVPAGESAYMQDVFEALMTDPAAYLLTPRQTDMVDEMRSVMEQARDMMRQRGMDKKFLDQMGVAPTDFLADPKKGSDSWRRYFPRLVLGQINPDGSFEEKGQSGGMAPSERKAFDKQRLTDANGNHKTVAQIKNEPDTQHIVYSNDPFQSIEWFLRNSYMAVAAHDLATDPDILAASTGKGRGSLGESMTINIPVISEMVFDQEDTQVLDRYLSKRKANDSKALDWVETQALRKKNWVLGAFDWAAPLTVGKRFTLDPRNIRDVPIAMMEAIKGWGSRSGNDAFIVANAGLYEELSLLNSTASAGFEYQQALDQVEALNLARSRTGRTRDVLRNTAGKYSLLQANARFHRMYLDAAKVLMWKGMRQRFADPATGNLRTDPDSVNEMMQEVAALDRSLGMTNDIMMSGASAKARSWMNIIFTAPSMYAAFANQPLNSKGLQHLSWYAAGSYLAYAGMAMLAGMDNEEMLKRMDPRNKNWMVVDLPMGDRTIKFGLSSFYKSLTKTMVQAVKRPMDYLTGKTAITQKEQMVDPWLNFAKSRRSPFLTLMASVATQEDFFGNVSTLEQSILQNVTPLSVNEPTRVFVDRMFRKLGIKFDSASYEEEQHGILKHGTLATVLISFFGVNAYTEQSWQAAQKMRNDMANKDFDQDYTDLTRNQQQGIAWRMRDVWSLQARPEDRRRWETFTKLQESRFKRMTPNKMWATMDEIGYSMTPMQDQKWAVEGAGNWSAPMDPDSRRKMWQKQIDLFKDDVEWAGVMKDSGAMSHDDIRRALTFRETELRAQLGTVGP